MHSVRLSQWSSNGISIGHGSALSNPSAVITFFAVSEIFGSEVYFWCEQTKISHWEQSREFLVNGSTIRYCGRLKTLLPMLISRSLIPIKKVTISFFTKIQSLWFALVSLRVLLYKVIHFHQVRGCNRFYDTYTSIRDVKSFYMAYSIF